MTGLSDFPDQIDSFTDKTDIPASAVTDIRRYQFLKLKDPRTPAEEAELATLTATYRNQLFLPDDLNKLQDATVNLQTFARDRILDYYQYRGNWTATPSPAYSPFNSVTFLSDGNVYIATQTPGANPPTDTNFWLRVTAKGDQGDVGPPGAALNYRGSFALNETYNINDLVTYQGAVYFARQNGLIGVLPTVTASWTLFVSGTGENLADLITTNKNRLVDAINEVKTSTNEIEAEINTPSFMESDIARNIETFSDTIRDGSIELNIEGRTINPANANPDFYSDVFSASINRWSTGGGSTISGIAGTMRVVGNGTSPRPRAISFLGNQFDRIDGTINKTFFVRGRMRVTNSTCERIQLFLRDDTLGTVYGTQLQEDPDINEIYTMFRLVQVNATLTDDLLVGVDHEYTNGAAANGMVMEVFEVTVLDMDDNPDLVGLTADQIHELVPDAARRQQGQSVRAQRVKTNGINLAPTSNGSLRNWRGVDSNSLIVDGDLIISVNQTSGIVVGFLPLKLSQGEAYTLSARGFVPGATSNSRNLVIATLSVPLDDFSDSAEIVQAQNITFRNDASLTRRSVVFTPSEPFVSACLYFIAQNGSVSVRDIQVQPGSTLTDYEPYEETLRYINPGFSLKSLDNGVRDEYNNDGSIVKRISDVYELQSADITTINTVASTNNDLATVPISTFENFGGLTNGVPTNMSIFGFDRISNTSPEFNDVANRGKWFTSSTSNNLFIVVSKGTDLATARAMFTGMNEQMRIIWQLDEPEYFQRPVAPLPINADGSMVIEKIVGDVGFYGTNMAISDTSYYISRVERLFVVNQATGVKTQLDASLAAIASSRQTFTHTDLSEGDLVDFDYEYFVSDSSLPAGDFTIPLNLRASVISSLEAAKSNTDSINAIEKRIGIGGSSLSIEDLNDRVASANVRIGLNSLEPDDSSPANYSNVVAIGENVLENLDSTPGDSMDIVIIGTNAGQGYNRANSSVVVGANSGLSVTTILDSVCVGDDAGRSNTTLTRVTAVGTRAASSSVARDRADSVYVGTGTGNSWNGLRDVIIGSSAAPGSTSNTANDNVIIGYASCALAASGLSFTNSVIIGSGTCSTTSFTSSGVVVGQGAAANRSVRGDTIVGAGALVAGTAGNDNVAVGRGALGDPSFGNASFNTAVGTVAMNNFEDLNSGATNNTALGQNCLAFNIDSTLFRNGINVTGIGQGAQVSGSNQLQLGKSGVTVYGSSAYNVRSDRRDKADIEETKFGLNFITKLEPVQFRIDERDEYFLKDEDGQWVIDLENKCKIPTAKDGSLKRKRFHQGFIAQQVKEVADEIGHDFAGYQDHLVNNEIDVKTLSYSEFIGPIVKSIQELKAMIDTQQQQINTQQEQIDNQQEQINDKQQQIDAQLEQISAQQEQIDQQQEQINVQQGHINSQQGAISLLQEEVSNLKSIL